MPPCTLALELLSLLARLMSHAEFTRTTGVPIPPEEIEQHMQSMSNAKIAQVLEREQQPGGDPPAEGEIRLRSEAHVDG